MSAPAKSKREQLGEVIVFLRGELSMSQHNLADKARTSTKEVARWEKGDLVPTSQEWQRLRGTFHQLNAVHYRELYSAAAAEQLGIQNAKEAADAKAPKSDGGDMDAAIRLLVDAVPNIRSLSIEVDDDGKISVGYRTREVRVVEETGTLSLRVRP